MSSLTDLQKKEIAHQQMFVAAAHKISGLLATNKPSQEILCGFDSLLDKNAADEKTDVAQVFEAFDGLGEHANEILLKGVSIGMAGYKDRHGVDASPEMVAAGLAAGAALLTVKSNNGKGTLLSGFDSIGFGSAEQPSVVPEMTVVTIATAIANSIPMVAMLPNAMGSNQVPLVYARFKANRSHGGLDKDDFLDGERSTFMYVENRPTFVMTKVGATNEYTLTVRTHYADFAAQTPDTSSAAAPFIGGRVVVRVNGIQVATDLSRNNSRQSGTHSMTPESDVVIGGTPVSVSTSTVNLDTHSISVTFAAALPAGAVVTADVIYDYEREDVNGNPILTPPGCDIDTVHADVLASPSRALVRISIDAQTQMQNEMKLSPAAASLAYLQQRFYLEQNLRLLRTAKKIAQNNGRIENFDASRGVAGNQAATYNTTADLMSEVFKHIELAKLKITQRIGQAPAAYDLFVSDLMSVRFNQLPPERFIKSGVSIGRHDGIVRMGTLSDGTNVYYVPKSAGLLADAAQSGELMLTARGSEPAKAPFVGHMPVPPMVRMANASAFDERYGMFCRVAADINPLERFGDQNAIISCTNLPALG